MKKTETKSE